MRTHCSVFSTQEVALFFLFNITVHDLTFYIPLTRHNSLMQMVSECVTERLIDESYARWQLVTK